MACCSLSAVEKSACEVAVIVDVDMGNTRVKWRATQDNQVRGQGAHGTFGEAVSAISTLGSPERIRLSSVANDNLTHDVEAAARRWGCGLQVAHTTKSAGGVTCGYERPESMGVDRWLALIAAWQQYQCACVVVDAGSAVTIDVLDSRGQHRGGYIVPGMVMMRNSLLGGTAKIHVSDEIRRDITPGLSTQEAIDHGMLFMLRAFVDVVHEELSVREVNAKIIVTGGDGELLLPLKSPEAAYHRDLVMDGLAVIFP